MKRMGLVGSVFIIVFVSSSVLADATTTTTTASTPPPMQPATQGSIALNPDALVSAVVSNVQNKISQDPTFAGTVITVSNEPGVFIVLTGTVNSQAQIDAAINSAKSIPGVIDVKSNLTISGSSPTSTTTTTGSGGSTTTTTTNSAPTY